MKSSAVVLAPTAQEACMTASRSVIESHAISLEDHALLYQPGILAWSVEIWG